MRVKQIRAHIDQNEDVFRSTRQHLITLLGPISLLVGAVVVNLVILLQFGWLPGLVDVVMLVLLIAAAGNYLINYLVYRSVEFVLTSRRIIGSSGVLTYKSREIPLERISEVSLRVTLFQRLFKVGSLTIASVGDENYITFDNLPDPVTIRSAINAAVEARRHRGDTGSNQSNSANPSDMSPIEQIARLGDLFARGLITRDEFEVAKAQLLRKI